jgi:hypothetical protein
LITLENQVNSTSPMINSNHIGGVGPGFNSIGIKDFADLVNARNVAAGSSKKETITIDLDEELLL